MQNEELVHFTMVQHLQPSNVLLVSGGPTGQIAELKKYNPISIEYVENKRWLMTIMKDSVERIKSKGVLLYTTDPVKFLRQPTKSYDVVLLNLPDPPTLQTNRFYILEFYTLLKKRLSHDRVLSFGLSAPADYLNNASVNLYSAIFATLKKVFRNVIIIPGEQNYFLATDGQLTYNVIKALKNNGIENRYVNQYYMNDLFLKSRGETILSSFDQMAEPNQNLKPVLYQHELAYWLSYFSGKSVTQYSTWKYLYLNQLVIAIVTGCNSLFNPFT